MVTFPVLPLTGFTFLNLFGLLECLGMWLISMPVIKVYLPSFSNRAIGIINFERLSPNFIADTMNWILNSMFILVGWGRSLFISCRAHRGSTVGFLLLQCSSGVVRYPRDLQVSVATRCFCRVLIFVSS